MRIGIPPPRERSRNPFEPAARHIMIHCFTNLDKIRVDLIHAAQERI